MALQRRRGSWGTHSLPAPSLARFSLSHPGRALRDPGPTRSQSRGIFSREWLHVSTLQESLQQAGLRVGPGSPLRSRRGDSGGRARRQYSSTLRGRRRRSPGGGMRREQFCAHTGKREPNGARIACPIPRKIAAIPSRHCTGTAFCDVRHTLTARVSSQSPGDCAESCTVPYFNTFRTGPFSRLISMT